MALTHAQVWSALDRLAARSGLSASGLAKRAGLDPTSFNRSKRVSGDNPPRPRWPSTESVAKVLEATGVGFADFAALAEGREPGRRGVPLLGLAQAGADGFFDENGFPAGEGWDEVDFPGLDREGVYALEVTGASMEPVYRDGDRLVVAPDVQPRRGDRVVVRTTDGEVMAKEVARVTAGKLELRSLNPDYPARVLNRKDIAWVARILWASQ
jgi:phage repressor protein C with HTH and peptisase S24 domain